MSNNVINALANSVRLKLLLCLANDRKNVQELIANCDLAQSAVSQHLKKLRNAGLVKDEREGKYIYYSLTNPHIAKIATNLNELVKTSYQLSTMKNTNRVGTVSHKNITRNT